MRFQSISTSLGLVMATVVGLGMTASAQAQTVARDAETGQLRTPTAAEAKALAAKTTASRPVGLLSGKPSPKPIKHADGTVEQELDTSSLQYSVARRNADGSITMVCVTGEEHANRALRGAQVAAKAGKEHHHDAK
jgi:hypothetical protein